MVAYFEKSAMAVENDLSKLAISDKSAPPETNVDWRIKVAGVVVVLLLVYWLVWPSSKENVTERAPTANTPSAPATSLAASSGGEFFATGYVVAQRQAAVASKATGRLKELRVEEGDQVKKGDILGVLENEDLQAVVGQATAQLEALKASQLSAAAELNEAQLAFTRASRLVKLRAIPTAEAEAAEARVKIAEANVAAAAANVRLHEAALEKAKVDLNYTFIVAPFDGTVLSKNADVGEIVDPFGSSTTARAAIVTIADMSSLEVEADVSESQIQRVKVGQKCEITLDAFPDLKYEGTVNKVVPTVDRAKATVLTRVKFNSVDARVIPEMSAKVIFKE